MKRPYPSFWMYKDNQDQWRWTYHARNGEAIAVSSEAYVRRVDCRRSIALMQESAPAPVWLPTDLSGQQ
ncbi:DUF1508 domain-containing protein [Mesorhizobium sp. WSM2239]|uniref:DUF1508 domain-containing protein n=2 Tax=unclassified Mesorhizobium TaxID=325217 RepID=A0AAU8DHE1_9HYPH